MRGVIKRVNPTGGFGFIKSDNGVEYFFHRSAVENADFATVHEGQSVEFEPGEGPKGPRAEQVRVGR